MMMKIKDKIKKENLPIRLVKIIEKDDLSS